MITTAGGHLVHLLDDVDAGVLVLAWIIGERVFLKNRIWMRWA